MVDSLRRLLHGIGMLSLHLINTTDRAFTRNRELPIGRLCHVEQNPEMAHVCQLALQQTLRTLRRLLHAQPLLAP